MTLSAWNSIQYDLFTYHGWLAQSIFNIRGTKKSLRSKNLWDSWPCYLSGSLQNISRIWGQSPKRQNVVFSQFSTINALGRGNGCREIWYGGSSFCLNQPQIFVELMLLYNHDTAERVWDMNYVCFCIFMCFSVFSHLITYKLFLLMANGIRNTHKEYIWIVWGKSKPLQ